MKRYILYFILASLLLPHLAASSSKVSVKNLRLWNAPDNTRVVLDLSSGIDHRISTFSNPDRNAIYLNEARHTSDIPHDIKDNPFIKRLLYGQN